MLFSVGMGELVVLQMVGEVELLGAAGEAALVAALGLRLVRLHVRAQRRLTAERGAALATRVGAWKYTVV